MSECQMIYREYEYGSMIYCICHLYILLILITLKLKNTFKSLKAIIITNQEKI